ncbi:MAG: hypothetical protein HGA45_40175 [Chloroflexales bacterium]|nr:hypothetical protein [Chloroflexales bacterium]
MEWQYDSRTRCWRLMRDGWEACVERWPASLEYLAQLTSPAPERRVVRAPHVFNGLETAQAWCLDAMMGQRAG